MSCNCTNKEYHSCQNGGECKCGGKCREDNYFNAVGNINVFKEDKGNRKKLIGFIIGGITLTGVSLIIIKNLI
tara:strand:+ start:888 stop:1106 length:219 start_codon:yes stop_codon:yes gene_type:complete